MRSERPKPLHLLCGRAMVCTSSTPSRASTSTGPSSWSATAPSGSPRSSRSRRPPSLHLDVRRAARAAGHRRRRERRPHRLPRRRPRRRRRRARRCPATRRCCGPTTLAALVAAHRRPTARRAPSSPPASTTRPATAASCGARTTASPASSSRPTPPPRSGRSTRSTPSIYCFRRDLLGPGAAPAQPRQRPGRVLPDRRRRGARRRRLPGRRRRGRRRRRDRRASTTGCSWPRPRPSCGAAPTTRWLRAGRHHGRPAPAPTSTPPSSSAADVTLFPGTILQGRTVDRRRLRDRARHPPGRLHGRRRRRGRAHGRPRAPRSAPTPRVGPFAVLEPGRAVPSGARDRAVLHCASDRRALSRASGAGVDGAGHQEAAAPLLGPHPPGAGRGDRRPPRRRARRPQPRRVRQRRDPLPLRRERPRRRRLHHPDPLRRRRAARSTTRSWSS